jgi:hypothetical protein
MAQDLPIPTVRYFAESTLLHVGSTVVMQENNAFLIRQNKSLLKYNVIQSLYLLRVDIGVNRFMGI